MIVSEDTVIWATLSLEAYKAVDQSSSYGFKPTAFFHGRGPVWENGRAGKMDFINLVVSVLEGRGFNMQWMPFSEDIEALARSDLRHLHVVLDDMPMVSSNIVFCIPSYLHGFWYFDPIGTRNNSSMKTKLFQPEKMSEDFAASFAAKLRSKFIDGNRSKFDQNMRAGFTPESGSICIFSQDFKEPKYYQHHMTYPELIEGIIAHRNGRHIYIKPHPRQCLEETMTLMSYHNPKKGVSVVDHSIHGLLANAAVAVSLSSAVLLEAQLHGVPGVVAGEVDFSHNMVQINTSRQIGSALEKALSDQFQYEKYLVFFFAQGMAQPHLQKKSIEHINSVLTAMGFDGNA